jgi:hypothetical protein
MTIDPKTTEAGWFRRMQREQAELEARYEAIGQAWIDSRIPTFVLKTPDWQTGWHILHNWLGLHDFRGRDPKAWESICARSWPNAETSWFQEIHIYSHMHSPTRGHNMEHAAIEEEGTRAILAWWQKIQSKETAVSADPTTICETGPERWPAIE